MNLTDLAWVAPHAARFARNLTNRALRFEAWASRWEAIATGAPW